MTASLVIANCSEHGRIELHPTAVRLVGDEGDAYFFALVPCVDGCVVDYRILANEAMTLAAAGAMPVVVGLANEMTGFVNRCERHCAPCAVRLHGECRGGSCQCPVVRCVAKQRASAQ